MDLIPTVAPSDLLLRSSGHLGSTVNIKELRKLEKNKIKAELRELKKQVRE